MKKRLCSLLLALCMVFSLSSTAFAAGSDPIVDTSTYDFIAGEIAYKKISNKTVEVAAYKKIMPPTAGNAGAFVSSMYDGKTITVPATVTDNNVEYTVVGIGWGAFGSSKPTSVTLPTDSESFTYIGEHAFDACTLTSLTIPASVTEIQDSAFAWGSNFTSISFAETSQLQSIGNSAFAGCSSLSSLTLPASVQSIGSSVFAGCTALGSITIPASVTDLAPDAFASSGSVKTPYYGNGHTISFADGCKYKIQNGILYDDESLLNVYEVQESVTVPGGIKYIGDNAFQVMPASSTDNTLTSITFPSTLVSIGDSAFQRNTGLTSITIPSNVTDLGTGVFLGCSGITEVTIEAALDEIPDYTFSGTSITTIDLPDSVTRIGANAFENCDDLTSIDIPDSATEIGEKAFNGCSVLTSIEIPDSVTEIGIAAFSKCGLSEVALPASLTEISDQLFLNSKSLKNLDIPDGVQAIGEKAFGNCNALELVIVPASVTNIGKQAFQGVNNGSGVTVVMLGEAPTVDSQVFGTGSSSQKPESMKVYYPADYEAAYKDTALVGESENNGFALSLAPSTTMALASSGDGGSNTLTLSGVTVPEGMTLGVDSSNEQVATAAFADGKLTVTGVTAGEATITATLSVNGYTVLTDTCTVTVTAAGAVVPTVEEPVTDTTKITDGSDKTTAGTVAGSVAANTALQAAATQQAANMTNTEALIQQGTSSLNPSDGQNVTLYTQTYLHVEATDLTKGDGGTVTSITLNITPKVRVVASTASDSASVEVKADDDGAGNAVIVQNEQDLIINTAAQITVTLPNNFASQQVFVEHVKNGHTYYYHATANGSASLTFTSSHGFSPFAFSLTNAAVAEVGDVGYGSLQDAISEAGASDTITLNQTGLSASTTKDLKLTNSTGGAITVTINGTQITIEANATYTYNYVAPSYGGGGATTYIVSAPSDVTGGDVTVSPSRAERGDTVTITVTPDEGYELDELTVTDASGNRISLTDAGNGRYTFTMPRSRVTVEATFAEIEEEPTTTQIFNDVPASAYYYDAVYWAVENGVTYGTTDTTFTPERTVTRAEMVTFLWRAHGSPEPESSVNPFTDVSSSAYYYDAVLWAVENGVTNGTSAATFSPDATVTRAQAVTFQWRAAGSPAVSGGSFADVTDDAYYADAVTWAVDGGVTYGTGGNNFSPDVGVSRAQAVTFLYRQLG